MIPVVKNEMSNSAKRTGLLGSSNMLHVNMHSETNLLHRASIKCRADINYVSSH